MSLVTIQVLEGLERGKVFENLLPPVTIGREDENVIRLNDERISRFHAKIQEDGGRIILTDLDSTNGTRVNGHPVQLKVLRPGDLISLGRCLLVFGSAEELRAQAHGLKDGQRATSELEDRTVRARNSAAGLIPRAGISADERSVFPEDLEYAELFPHGPPEPPAELPPLARAQVSDMLAYLHDSLCAVIQSGREQLDRGEPRTVGIDWSTWQKLIALELDLARYLRAIVDPEHR